MSENKVKGGGEQNLTVALRIRPLNEDEILQGATQIAYKVQKKMVVLMDPMEDPEDVLRANRSREKQFVFDYTFDGGASQGEVYRTTSQFLIPSVISGYNATVFAYGATGAGKTYTMLGAHDEPGIMAQALNDLFLEVERTSEDMSYKVTMSYLEIYNEMIRDLLNPSAGILDLREDAKGGVQVAGLSEVMARSTDEVIDMLLKGNKERTQEPTAANKTSSRSHAVLQVSIKQQNRVRNTTQEVRMGRLFMIDLAGSERAANTHNRGKRMVEGAHINRSLLALGNCINALTDTKGSKYVNYRDSKLTRLLKEALGGNCKTVMIAHISPASLHFEESRNTLVYADRAKHIKTKVRRNVTDVSYHIAQYTNIIQELREEIQRLRHRLHDKSSPRPGANILSVQAEVVEAKREELTKLKEQLLISFKDQMELRKSLMELNNASMEVSLETNRNQLIISEWELERARFSRRKEGGDKADTEDSKALELAGAGSDDLQETEDVKLAREELKVLHDEKHRTEKLRTTVMKELEQARVKTRRIEETIPHRINTEDQREILSLLCKVHELEIENTETQSACLLREFQIKRKDMVISRFRQHQNLCDQIIRRQKKIMEENKIAATQDLEELYNLYQLEQDDRMMLREDSGHLSPELRLKASSNSSNYRNLPDEVDQLSTLTEEDERGNLLTYRSGDGDDKLFSRSARGLKGGASLTGAWRNDSNLSNGASGRNSDQNGAFGHPSPDNRKEIASNTRSIAALAAKKRSKAHSDLLNLERQFGGEPRTLYRNSGDKSNSDNDYLSPSTLAKHDRNYGELVLPPLHKPPSEDNLDNISTGTKQSTNTDSTLPPLRNENNFRRGDIKRNRRTRGYDVTQNRRSQSLGDNGKSGDSREWTPPGVTKRGGKTKRFNNRGSNEHNGNTNNRKKAPTIPSYKKGDITVMGFSLPR
ncbi:kinesin-like protein KIF19 [Saccostrea cucullata]|uniref:kinesin-like protein KIF19 n=1 Tax=Saccostrea cuccullata TaxID=36930 RepID=UPI002ED6BD1C